MRRFCLRSLLFLLLLISTAGFSQEKPVVRIGVTPLGNGGDKVSVTTARDHLVKALNHQKVDKQWGVTVQAVALNESAESKALAEARDKNCQFVVTSRLADLHSSEKSVPGSAFGTIDNVPVIQAKVSYEMRRVVDGLEYALGSVSSEESTITEAVMEAHRRLAPEIVAELKKGGNVPHPAAEPEKTAAVTFPKTVEVAMIGVDFCKWLPSALNHAEALRGVCEYSFSLPQRMPNFICDQETSRYRGDNPVPRDLITALVRYEDGNESYSDIKLNGKPAPSAITNSPGLWSTGEFGSNLRAVFDLRNQPLFEFAGENAIGAHPTWVFTYQIRKQNDPLWRLRAEDQVLAPPYDGELWIDQKTGDLLRFRQVAREIPAAFPTQSAELQTNYDNVAFADGTSFLLPSEAIVATRYREEGPTHNMLQFRNCHKFRAKSRMLLDVPVGVASAAPASTSPEDIVREAEEGEKIQAILREEAVREDDGRLQRERRDDLDRAQFDIFTKLAALEKERQKVVAQEIASAKPEPRSGNDAIPVFKSSVHLVPVSVVLHDGKGKTIGTFRKEDFQLFDDGKLQAITAFSIERPGEASRETRDVVSVGSIPAVDHPAPERSMAFVFDDIHSSFADLASARAAAGRQIDRMREEDRVAIFSTSGQSSTDFISDRAKLHAALNGLKPHPVLPVSTCPRMTAYMADQIATHNDADLLAIAIHDTIQCAMGGMATTPDEIERAARMAKLMAYEVFNAASADNQSTLNSLREIVRRTAAAAGNHSIVFVSPGFVSLAPETRVALAELFDRAVRSGIVVNTLDVRGLETLGVSGERTNPGAPENLQLARDESSSQSETMAEMADATGGTYFHNNNDLDEGFRKAAETPEVLYVLGFSPQKLDGKFHKLKVKLAPQAPVGKNVEIQARLGYFAVKARTE